MHWHRANILILISLAGLVLGSIVSLTIEHAFHLKLVASQVSHDQQSAARADLPNGNHYQIVAVSNKAFRIDTQTGKVWVYDEEGFELLTLKYLQEHGFTSTTQENLDKLLQSGYAFGLPAHWKEVPGSEAVEGDIEMRSLPQARRAGR